MCSTAPAAGDREVQLEMALVVPREGPDPVALLHTEPPERPGEAVDALGDLAEGGALHGAGRSERHDLRVRTAGAHPAADVMQGQWKVVLHEALQKLRHPLLTPSSRGAGSASSP